MWQLRQSSIFQRAPFLRLLPALVAGILYWQLVSPQPPIFYLYAVTLLCILGYAGLALLRFPGSALKLPRFLLLQASLFLAGLSVCMHQDHRSNPLWYGHFLGETKVWVATITVEPEQRQRSWKVSLNLNAAIDSNNNFKDVKGQSFLYLYRTSDTIAPFHQGDLILLPNTLQAISNTGNPADFDLINFYARNNIFHSQILPADEVVLYRSGISEDLPFITRAHNWCVKQLRQYLPNKESFGLLHAMLMGDERDFDPELRLTYSETGIVHLVSISGSHVATLYAFVAILFFWLKKSRLRWLPLVLGTVIVWLYVLMAGAPPSAIRSAVMFTVFAGATLLSRDSSAFNTLLTAAFLLLLAQPMWLFAVGFQLSFLAVLSLILFYQPLYKLWPLQSRIPRLLWQLACASIAAELLTAPLVAYYFHNFPVLFLVANIVAFVVIGLLAMFGGLFILMLFWWPTIAHLIGQIVAWALSFFNQLLRWMNTTLSPEAFRYISISALELVLLYGMLAGMATAWLLKKRNGLLIMLTSACLFMISICTGQWEVLHQEKFVVYNLSRHFLAEQYLGRQHRIMATDTVLRDERAVRTARTAYHAWQPANRDSSAYFIFKNKNILLLLSPLTLLDSFPNKVNVLVAAYPLKVPDLIQIQKCFNPDTIVIAGYQKLWVKQQLQDTVFRKQYPLHLVWEDGAFLLH